MDTNKLNIDNANNTNEKLKFDNLYSNTHKLLVDSSSYDTLPTVHIIGYYGITSYSVNLQGIVSSTGGAEIVERGFVWSTSVDPIAGVNHTIIYYGDAPETYPFYCTPTNLQKNTTYYFRAWAVNSVGIAYSNNTIITTANATGEIPYIDTENATNIGSTSATLNSYLADDGGNPPVTCGWLWAYHEYPLSWADSSVTYGTIAKSNYFGMNVSNLLPDSHIRFQSWAINSAGIHFAQETLEFNTLSSGPPPTYPTVLTIDVSDISTNYARGRGNVITTGNAYPVYRGFTWATHINPVPYPHYGIPSDPSVLDEVTSGTGIFDVSLTNLEPSTRYYARAFAYNSMGISWSFNYEFSTLPSSSATTYAPTVRIYSIANITTTSFNIMGQVGSDGGATPVYRGFCYSGLRSGVSIADTSTQISGSGIGYFSTTISNLSSGVTYYVNAFAYNSVGTSYGSEVEITTLTGDPVSAPTVVTIFPARNITSTSADVSGNVTHDGSIFITKKGISWSTNSADIANKLYTKESVFSGEGPYFISLTGLHPSTTYYYAAYAYNYMGNSFGTTYSFTTTSGTTSAPTVITGIAENITNQAANVYGEVTSDGNIPLTYRGICYKTSSPPTIADSSVLNLATGKGAYNCTLSGLSSNTTYYARAFAYNSQGLSYGSTISFSTLNILPPQISDIKRIYGPTKPAYGYTEVNLSNLAAGDLFIGTISTQSPNVWSERRFNLVKSQSSYSAYNDDTYRYKRITTKLFWGIAAGGGTDKLTFQMVNIRNVYKSDRCVCQLYVLKNHHSLDSIYSERVYKEDHVAARVIGEFPSTSSVMAYYTMPSITSGLNLEDYICISFLITDSYLGVNTINKWTPEVYSPESFISTNNCNSIYTDNFYYGGSIASFSSYYYFRGTSIDLSGKYWILRLAPYYINEREDSKYQIINWAIA